MENMARVSYKILRHQQAETVGGGAGLRQLVWKAMEKEGSRGWRTPKKGERTKVSVGVRGYQKEKRGKLT